MAAEACRLNGPYLKRLTTGLPYVLAKWAMTLDGKTAASSGDSRWISSARSRALVHETRGRMDAIIAGIGTVLADDPRLNARPPGSRIANRVIFDSEARLPTESNLASTAREIPVILAVTDRADPGRLRDLEALGCSILRFPGQGRVPVVPLLEKLGNLGMTNILVEGGGAILGAFLDAGQVDEVDVFIAPRIEGGSHGFSPVRGLGHPLMAQAIRLDQPEVSVIDGDVRIQAILPGAWRQAFALDDPQG
jgi:diaminohydroxyphosphoribosylaminopyrimidine deaminase/5-amino-6-(5-phosphoribosylamino)uracil reductase